MTAVLSLLILVTLGLLVTRVATVALTMTGMSLDHARFQARSAFTGTGFTTAEAEAIVGHPVRRRIVMVLMLVSGVGAISVIGTLLLTFLDASTAGSGLRRGLIILGGSALLLWLSRNRVVDRALRRVIERLLRRFTDLEVRDYAALLHLRGEWHVAQVPVAAQDWVSARPLGELGLPTEGVAVLGVEQADGTWLGAPDQHLRLGTGDVVVLYGRRQVLEDIADRAQGPAGDAASERSRAWHAADQEYERRGGTPPEG